MITLPNSHHLRMSLIERLINKALHESGYEMYLKYLKKAKTTNTNNNRRNIIWFNHPYSENVETNICHESLNPVTKHFHKHHRLHEICNKNNIKISFSCMPNMSAVISSHNKTLLFTLPKADRLPTAIQIVVAVSKPLTHLTAFSAK